MGELSNCPNCGQLFVKALRDVCQNCYKAEEDQFQTVYQYVRKKENRMASMNEVTEATGVPEKLIIKFIKQGRLNTAQFPNLAYPCESCGKPIQQGKICDGCKGNIRKGLDQLSKEEAFANRKKEQKQHTYHTMNNRLDRNR